MTRRRRRRARVLFVAKYPMHYVMFQPLHERLRDDPRYEVRVLARMYGEKHARTLATELGIRPQEQATPFGARWRRHDAVIAADYFAWPARGAVKIQIFHGCSFKNAAIHAKATEWDHLFLVGPYMRERFVASGLFDASDPRLHLVGMPKVDRLARGDSGGAVRRSVALAHGLDPARPIVLYAPTCHEHESSLGTFGPELALELAERGACNLLVKLHDHSLDRRYNQRDWGAWLAELAARPNVAAFSGRDAREALLAADLLISDASSIAYEYAILDRPIVFLETTITRPTADLETFGRSIGLVAATRDAALAAIERGLAHPGELAERRRALVARIFHDPGHATDHALAALDRILEVAPAM